MLLLLKYEKLYIFIIIHDSFILPLIKIFGSTTVSDHTQTACSLIIEDEFYWKNKWVTGSSMLQLRNPIHGNIVTAKGKFGSMDIPPLLVSLILSSPLRHPQVPTVRVCI